MVDPGGHDNDDVIGEDDFGEPNADGSSPPCPECGWLYAMPDRCSGCGWRESTPDLDDEEARGRRYVELMREHKYLLSPGDEGYEQGSRVLPCGYRLLSPWDSAAGRTRDEA